jgi:DNA-binding beta-propeller fold protein YncE
MSRVPIHLLLLIGCSADYDLGKASDKASSDTGGSYEADADTDADTDADADSDDTAPPEDEDDFLSLAPSATDAYVFVANPTRNTVTRISVPSLAVLTTEVGEGPSVIATTADYSRAVTLNESDDSVSIIEADTLEVRNVDIRPNFNRLALSDDAGWVMAWYDPDLDESAGTDDGGVQSFNEVSFVRLDSGAHTPLAVGFNPRGVRWSADGTLALVISDASLAVIDLTADSLSPVLVEIADDPVDAPEAEEVELSPDGAYAYVRQFGSSDLVIVDITTLAVDRLPIGANPTDLDLSPDGSQLAVVARGSRELWLLDAADPFAAATVVPFDSPYGSLLYTGDGTQAILYTNAALLASFGVWDTTDGTVTERSLVKPVQSIGASPTGGSLLVFHTEQDADDADPDSPFAGEWALTLMDLGDFRQNPMRLPAEPASYSTSDDGLYGYFVMEGNKWLEVLDFQTLLYEEITLKSPPVHLGVLPGSQTAWVSQDHDLGRLSFYDPDASTLDTITGFELNSEIDHD